MTTAHTHAGPPPEPALLVPATVAAAKIGERIEIGRDLLDWRVTTAEQPSDAYNAYRPIAVADRRAGRADSAPSTSALRQSHGDLEELAKVYLRATAPRMSDRRTRPDTPRAGQ